MPPLPRRPVAALLALLFVVEVGVTAALSQGSGETRLLREDFTPDKLVRARVESRLTGRIALPKSGQDKAEVLPFVGKSTLEYDERPLKPLEDGRERLVRCYRAVDYARTVADQNQSAEVRANVRRVVVARAPSAPGVAGAGRKLPFSPDGPLTASELDIVRIDLFAPAFVPGLLPTTPVKVGDRWKMTAAALMDLTDYTSLGAADVQVEWAAVVQLNGARLAKLTFAGKVEGATDDGPGRQAVSGTAYFDLERNMLTYFKLSGQNQLFGPGGVVAGDLRGTFTLTRSVGTDETGLDAITLDKLDLKPTPENTRLMHADSDVSFTYPRNWRVKSADDGRVVLEEQSGAAGLSLTSFPAGKLPTAKAYLAEVVAAAPKNGWTVVRQSPPENIAGVGAGLERFSLDVTVNTTAQRLIYYVRTTPGGRGTTVAVRVKPDSPAEADARELVEKRLTSAPPEQGKE